MSHRLPSAWRLTLTAGLATFIGSRRLDQPHLGVRGDKPHRYWAQARVPLWQVVRILQWLSVVPSS